MTSQDDRYREAVEQYGPALQRLAGAYEANPDRRRDLIQEIHFQLWRSFARYDAKCSLRTWIYRVAHHVAVSHVMKEHRVFSALVSLEEVDLLPGPAQAHAEAERRIDRDRLLKLVQKLKPLDRQVILGYLEGLEAAEIGEITGLSSANVAMKIHRIKIVLTKRFQEGGTDAQ